MNAMWDKKYYCAFLWDRNVQKSIQLRFQHVVHEDGRGGLQAGLKIQFKLN